jgi:hypothetical protein
VWVKGARAREVERGQAQAASARRASAKSRGAKWTEWDTHDGDHDDNNGASDDSDESVIPLPSAPPAYEDVVNTQRRDKDDDDDDDDDSDDAMEPGKSRRLRRLRKRLPKLKFKQVSRENALKSRRQLMREALEEHQDRRREWARAGFRPSESLARHPMTRHPLSMMPDIYQLYRMDRWRFAWFGATPGNDPRYTYKWLMCLLQNESFAVKHEFLSGEPMVTKGWL